MSQEQPPEKNPRESIQSASKNNATDFSLLTLSISAVLGLVLVATVLWLIFGTPSADRPGAADRRQKGLTKNESMVIFADDDAAESGSKAPESDADDRGKLDTRSAPKENSNSPAPGDSRTAKEPTSRTGKRDQPD